MPSYINSSTKAAIRSAYSNLQDTFSRTITVYKTAKKVRISIDPDFNALYSSGPTTSVDYQEVSSTFAARVIYERIEEKDLGDEDLMKQSKVKIPDGWIRVIVNEDGFDYLKEARKAEVDGRIYEIKSDGKPRGFWEPQFYEFLLTPLDEAE